MDEKPILDREILDVNGISNEFPPQVTERSSQQKTLPTQVNFDEDL